MSKISILLLRRLWLVWLLLACSAYSAQVHAQPSFRSYSPTTCPNQTVTYVIDNIPNKDYRINGAQVRGGSFLNTPQVSNNRAEYQVIWGAGTASGSITPGLEKPVYNSQGGIVSYEPVTVGNTPSVIIKSVFGVNINGPITSSGGTDLPLCGGAQTLTLSVPQYYYDDARQYPAEAYVWEIPSNFTVVNGVQATDFGAGRWLSGNSITITVPAGQFSQVVRVVIWSKECNQNPAYGNPPATLISTAQSVVIRRTTPVISSIAASRTSLTCGDQSPLTLTAITSQSGVSSFQWSLPAGWAFASGSSSNAASISVIPTGSAPAGGSNLFQIGVTARYACVVPAYEVSSSRAIGYSNQVATPVISGNQPVVVCNGASTDLGASAVGALRYEWTTSGPGLQIAYLTGTGSQVRITAPASGSFDATVQVRAFNDALGCAASNSATYRFRVGSSATPAEIFINGYYPASNGQYVPPQPCGTVYFQLMNGSPADVTGVVWTTDGTIISGQGSGVVQIRFPENAVYGSAVARYTNACGTSDGILATVPFREECRNGGGPPRDCIDCEVYGFRSAYPNPADNELVLEEAAGAPTLYDSYGKPVRQMSNQRGTIRLPTHDLPAGLYYLEVRSPAKGYKRMRVRIQH